MTLASYSDEEDDYCQDDEEYEDPDDEGGWKNSTGRFRVHIDGHLRFEFFTGDVTFGLWLYPWFSTYLEAKWVAWWFYSKLRFGWGFWGIEYINHARSTYHSDRVRSVVKSREIMWLWDLQQRWKKWRAKDEA